LQLLLALTQHSGGVLAQDLGCSQRAERQSPSQ
jgi:biotin operon repressor